MKWKKKVVSKKKKEKVRKKERRRIIFGMFVGNCAKRLADLRKSALGSLVRKGKIGSTGFANNSLSSFYPFCLRVNKRFARTDGFYEIRTEKETNAWMDSSHSCEQLFSCGEIIFFKWIILIYFLESKNNHEK